MSVQLLSHNATVRRAGVSRGTVWRWSTRGKLVNGERVKLRTLEVEENGRRRLLSRPVFGFVKVEARSDGTAARP